MVSGMYKMKATEHPWWTTEQMSTAVPTGPWSFENATDAQLAALATPINM